MCYNYFFLLLCYPLVLLRFQQFVDGCHWMVTVGFFGENWFYMLNDVAVVTVVNINQCSLMLAYVGY